MLAISAENAGKRSHHLITERGTTMRGDRGLIVRAVVLLAWASVVAGCAAQDVTAPTETGKRELLKWSDFEYLGAFSAPRRVSTRQYGDRYGYSKDTMCWNPKGDPAGEKDGFPGSIMIPGHDGLVGEFSVVPPKTLTDEHKQKDGTYDTRKLPAGKQLGKFTDPTSGKKNVFPKRAENWRGMWWDGDLLHMSWSLWYHVDSEVKNYPHKMAAKRKPDGTWQTVIEPYSMKIRPHRCAGYITTAPKWWADKHLGGRRFLTGFNVAQGTGASNCGPGLYAYDPKKPGDAITLMEFPHSKATRDEMWRPCDAWRGVVFIDTGAKYAVMFCGRKSLGEVYYGVGRPGDASPVCVFETVAGEVRLYDPEALLKVLKGELKPHQPRPAETGDLTKLWFQPDRAFLTAGIGYDPVNRLVYIAQLRGDRDSNRYEALPAIHVWRIR